MRKLREVMRLRFELHLGYQQIGRSCAIRVSTVCKYLQRAEAAGVTWPLPDGWDEARLEAALFPQTAASVKGGPPARSRPDFASIHEQLRKHRDLTLQLLWEEYRQANPDGYRYSRFCELYQRWRSKLDVVLRQEHRAGEKMFVDWAGSTIPIYDRHTGAAWQAPLFVAALGASSYTWAEATRDQQMEAWLRTHVHAFEHFGGIPALAVAETERRDFWEICEDRYQTRSTILTSRLPVARWHEQIGDPTAADGILDRLVHNAHRIEMRGDSMRKKRSNVQPSS